ncbi:MAG: polyphenol oxidase family protein [Polyangiaceae bacterium]
MAVYGDSVLLKVLTSPSLETAGFRHGFSTRRGPVAGVAATLPGAADAGFTFVGPTRDANLFTLACSVGFDPATLYQVNQVHGARALRVSGAPLPYETEAADALAVRAPRPLVGAPPSVGVRTADCVPLLVADKKTGDVAAIHAGWRGLVAGVVRAGLDALEPSSPSNLLVAVGPCIGACCFEVDSEVGETIARAVNDDGVKKPKDDCASRGKTFVDLRAGVRLALRALGVPDTSIEDVGGCTHCDAELHFSHRRDGAKAGRHVAVIVADKR